MDNTQKAVIEDEGQQPVALPTTEKPVEVATPPNGEESTTEPEGELPEEVKERTRQEFEKLKAKNKELSEKLNQYEAPKQERRSAFDLFNSNQVQYAPKSVKAEIEEIQDIVPDENGEIDVSVLNRTNKAILNRMQKLEEQAELARKKAELAEEKVSKYEHTEKSTKVYEKHPYLDPTKADQFDQKFSDLVRKELLDQMVNQGKEDYMEAADRVKREYYDPTPKTEKPKSDPKQEEVITKRNQINALQGASKSEGVQDQNDLVQASRMGDKNAIYERLKRSGY